MDHSPRVIYVTTGYPTENRPNQCVFIHRSIKFLSLYLETQVIHLRAWFPGRPIFEKRNWDGIEVISIACPQLPGGSYSYLNALLLSAFGIVGAKSCITSADIVHSTDLYPGGFVVSRWSRRFAKPATAHVIGSDLNLFLAPNIGYTGSLWLTRLKGIVCNSKALQKQLLALAPRLSNTQVIYRGVDTQKFNPMGPVNGPHVSSPPVRFLYLGGFHTWNKSRGEYNIKGGHTLLNAWQKVEDQVAPSSLIIAGPGTDTKNIHDWRLNLHRPTSVYIAGTIAPDAIASWIRACDVVVIPSHQEGLPNVANEAQACGKPVLGTDAGGIVESVANGETGLIVPRGDPKSLAEGLLWFWENQMSLKEMGVKGRKRMVNEFSWAQFSQGMLRLFLDVSKGT